jgi:hypothetical protein
MMVSVRQVTGLLALAMAAPAQASADDPFLGAWRLNKAASTIASDPGVNRKEYVFAQSADGVQITETVEASAEPGKLHVSRLAYTYGKPTPQTGGGFDTLLVVRTDERTVVWSALGAGKILAQLQVGVSEDRKRMTFRYLWRASDPGGATLGDRYVYERQ